MIPTIDLPFLVRGLVDGRPAVAVWADGRLHADPELRRRAEVIVGMGDRFELDGGEYACHASLRGGFATVLTVMRAFSIVTDVEIDFDVE
jgi:hypothetical protein